MQRLIIIILLSVSVASSGQQPTFRQVDTTTYNQYLMEEWNEVIRTGNAARENGIDYFYLRMRIAYAWFSKGKYRKAVGAYKEALKLNSMDPNAREYLYYSYKYSGRLNDALMQEKYLNDAQSDAMGINDSSGFVNFGIFDSWSFSDVAHSGNKFFSEDLIMEDGVQKSTNQMNFLRVVLSHRIGRSIILHHNGNLLHKNERSYVVSGGIPYLSEEQPVKQIEYNIDMDIRLAEGLIITPGYHYLYSTVPLYATSSYGPGSGLNRVPATYQRTRNRVFKLGIDQQTTYADFGFSWVNNNFNLVQTNQAGIHTTLYPLANLDLYVSINGYGQVHMFNSTKESGYLLHSLAGGKLHKNIWVEISGTIGDHFNFYDKRSAIAFNNLEQVSESLGVNVLIPLYRYRARMFFGYTYRSMRSGFFPFSDMLHPVNSQNYNTNMITGGIKWTR